MFAPIALMMCIRNYVDQEDPQTIMYMRIFFIGGQLLLFTIWAIIFFLIKKDTSLTKSVMTVTASDLNPPNPLFTSMGVPDPNADTPAQTMTHAQYDFKTLRTALFQQVMQCCIVGGIHYKWGTVMPLVMSVSMAILNIPSNPLVRLHLLKEDPTKLEQKAALEITRPFKPKSPFGDMMEQMNEAKENAALEQTQADRPKAEENKKTK